MQKKTTLQLIQVLLGVVIGALVTLSVVKYRDSRHYLRIKNEDWSKVNLVLDMVQKNYVDSIDTEEVTDAAVAGILSKLDPHSVYMPPVQLSAAQEDLASNFEGIGIQFNVPNDTAIVLEVIAGGPSEKAGLLVGDRLLKVDDQLIAGVRFPQDSMVRRMKGPAGTKVTVTVKRGKEEIPFRIVRGKIPVRSVDASFIVQDHVGYIRLAKFSRTTFSEFHEAALGLLDRGMKHLILDLRDNTGGYLDQALLMCNDFLERGDVIVFVKGREQVREMFRADGKGSLKDVGLTVLISENTASASEIVAGAIQDNDRGQVIGRRSFGKGLVQEEYDFSDHSGIRLTVARYYTPSGRCIQKPYDDYEYDIYNRYAAGEIFSVDSVKLDKTDIHHTRNGRVVYGGGGIMPDVFVPMDTTRATAFYQQCNRKATQMRFASAIFDRHRERLLAIDKYADMDRFLKEVDVESAFRSFASREDGITASSPEWEQTLPYLKPQLEALVARYSKLGENAYYRYYLPVDNTITVALEELEKK
jgi:carboxyl-terminal processing protease